MAGEIEKIRQLGVHINTGVTIGRDVNIDVLFERGFDAIFMGTGTGKPKKLPIEGVENDCVRQAIYFLRRVSLYNAGLIVREEVPVSPGDKVYVVGCGNTAIDAARTALRMDASEVTVVYHRDISHMSALRAEYDDAVAEGVKFLWNTSVTAVRPLVPKPVGDNLTAADGALSNDSSCLGIGSTPCRVTLENSEGGKIEVDGNKVILAVGSRPASRIVSTTVGIEVDANGYVITREHPYGMTTRKGVFAGGDVAGSQATVVHAMSDARAVAASIAAYVDAVNLLRVVDAR